jgi:hypothetical protein
MVVASVMAVTAMAVTAVAVAVAAVMPIVGAYLHAIYPVSGID